jgi:hypothetical protein
MGRENRGRAGHSEKIQSESTGRAKQWNAQHGSDQRYTIKTESDDPGARKMEGYTKMFPNIKDASNKEVIRV